MTPEVLPHVFDRFYKPRIATAAMEQLVHGVPHHADHSSPFPAEAQILSVTISDSIATVD